MITKTYLDIRLNQLEEKLKRKIEIKDEIALHKIEARIASLENNIELLKEKIEENKNVIRNYIVKQDDTKQEVKKVKPSENKNDIITSDF